MDPLDMLKNPDSYFGSRSSDLSSSLSGIYSVFLTIGTIGILISIIICGIKLASSKNPNSREEVKHELFWKIALGVLLFAFTGILGLIYAFTKDTIPS